MLISRIDRAEAQEARGVVIVIDVLRAFTVAAYAFAGGARALWLVRTVEEAFALRELEPGALLAGEVGGRLIPGFDLNNSPARMAEAEVAGRLLIQRTGAGTQGAVNAGNAAFLLPCALVNARATALHAQRLAYENDLPISLLPTAYTKQGPADFRPLEDDVCADYLEALLRGEPEAPRVLAAGIERLRTSGRLALWEQETGPDFPAADIPKVLATDSFAFAMQGARQQHEAITYIEVRRVDVATA